VRWHLLGERRALSLFVLGFSTTIFLLVGLSMGGAWARCFYALSAVYGLGFFALAAGWFWARWYVMGISVSGLTMAILGLVTAGWNIGLAIWGGIHLAIWAPLLGEGQADHYENRTEWRERWGVDEYGVLRIKRAVKGAATALPTLVFYALAPREGQALGLALVAVAAIGFYGLVRMRFWGVAMLMVSTVWTALSMATDVATRSDWLPMFGSHLGLTAIGLVALGALVVAISPFVVPAYRFLKSRP
jgi:hypothetical protein